VGTKVINALLNVISIGLVVILAWSYAHQDTKKTSSRLLKKLDFRKIVLDSAMCRT